MDEQSSSDDRVVLLYQIDGERTEGNPITRLALGKKPVLRKGIEYHTRRGMKRLGDTHVGHAYHHMSETENELNNGELWAALNKSMDFGVLLHVWLIDDAVVNKSGQFKSKHYPGYINAISHDGGYRDIEFDYELIDNDSNGYATVSEEQQSTVTDVFGEAVQETRVTHYAPDKPIELPTEGKEFIESTKKKGLSTYGKRIEQWIKRTLS